MRRTAALLATVIACFGAATTPATAAYQGVGDATYYDANAALGNCSYGRLSEVKIAAMNRADYAGSRMCGAFVEVTGPRGKVVVRIMDSCPECTPGDIDLNRDVYGQVADPQAGRVRVSWRVVSPPLATKVAFRYKEGSSRYWCAIQIRDHRNPVRALEVKVGGQWRSLPRADYNYFLAEDGRGCGADIRATDIHGNQIVETGVPLRVGVIQRGTKQFPGSA